MWNYFPLTSKQNKKQQYDFLRSHMWDGMEIKREEGFLISRISWRMCILFRILVLNNLRGQKKPGHLSFFLGPLVTWNSMSGDRTSFSFSHLRKTLENAEKDVRKIFSVRKCSSFIPNFTKFYCLPCSQLAFMELSKTNLMPFLYEGIWKQLSCSTLNLLSLSLSLFF